MRSSVSRGSGSGRRFVGAATAGVLAVAAVLLVAFGGCANDGSGSDGAHIRHGWMTESD